jgi:hypothetical protein
MVSRYSCRSTASTANQLSCSYLAILSQTVVFEVHSPQPEALWGSMGVPSFNTRVHA